MRMVYPFIAALTASVTFAVGTSATIAQPRRAPASAPLYPLSQRDLSSTTRSGCECVFRTSRNTYLFRMIGDELTIRTRAGRQVCRINDEQFSDLSNGAGAGSCAGIRMTVGLTGRLVVDGPSDSAEGPATLTLRQGRVRRTLAGRWGCAC